MDGLYLSLSVGKIHDRTFLGSTFFHWVLHRQVHQDHNLDLSLVLLQNLDLLRLPLSLGPLETLTSDAGHVEQLVLVNHGLTQLLIIVILELFHSLGNAFLAHFFYQECPQIH